MAEIATYGGAAFADIASADGLAHAIECCLSRPADYSDPGLSRRFETTVFRAGLLDHIGGLV